MNRRAFLALLASLPFVKAFGGEEAKKPPASPARIIDNKQWSPEDSSATFVCPVDQLHFFRYGDIVLWPDGRRERITNPNGAYILSSARLEQVIE